MELIAQIGLRPANLRRVSQSSVVAMKMFAEKWRPAQSLLRNRSRRSFALAYREVLAAEVSIPTGEFDIGEPASLDSLVRVGRIALEAINRAGLSGSEGEPFLGGILQIDEELLTAAAREEVQVLAFIGTALSGNWTLCEKSRR